MNNLKILLTEALRKNKMDEELKNLLEILDSRIAESDATLNYIFVERRGEKLTPHNILNRLFTWGISPQGHRYWSRVSYKLIGVTL